MNRNVKIAKELVKLAKSLVAENDETVTAGQFDETVTAGAFDNGNNVEEMFPSFIEKCFDDIQNHTVSNRYWCEQSKPFTKDYKKDDYTLSLSLSTEDGSTSATIILKTKLTKEGSSDVLFEDSSKLIVKFSNGDSLEDMGNKKAEELEKWLNKIYSPMKTLLINAAAK